MHIRKKQNIFYIWKKDKMNVDLIKENNDFFRDWIIKEWKHHNMVDKVYQ